MIAHYLGGLRVEISDAVQLQTCWTYNIVCKLAMKVEKQLRRGMVVSFDPIIERVFLTEGVIPLQRLLHPNSHCQATTKE